MPLVLPRYDQNIETSLLFQTRISTGHMIWRQQPMTTLYKDQDLALRWLSSSDTTNSVGLVKLLVQDKTAARDFVECTFNQLLLQRTSWSQSFTNTDCHFLGVCYQPLTLRESPVEMLMHDRMSARKLMRFCFTLLPHSVRRSICLLSIL